MEPACFLKASSISFGVEGKEIFLGLDLELPARGYYSLKGANGSGKSTLLGILSGHLKIQKGTIFLKGRKAGPSSLAKASSLVTSSPAFFASKTPLENLLLLLGKKGRERAIALLSRVGLEGKENQEALTLSDGEKARLSLAMALSKDPSLLLIDELDSHLDEATGERIEAILEKEGERRLVISASHRKEEGKGIIFLSGGRADVTSAPLPKAVPAKEGKRPLPWARSFLFVTFAKALLAFFLVSTPLITASLSLLNYYQDLNEWSLASVLVDQYREASPYVIVDSAEAKGQVGNDVFRTSPEWFGVDWAIDPDNDSLAFGTALQGPYYAESEASFEEYGIKLDDDIASELGVTFSYPAIWSDCLLPSTSYPYYLSRLAKMQGVSKEEAKKLLIGSTAQVVGGSFRCVGFYKGSLPSLPIAEKLPEAFDNFAYLFKTQGLLAGPIDNVNWREGLPVFLPSEKARSLSFSDESYRQPMLHQAHKVIDKKGKDFCPGYSSLGKDLGDYEERYMNKAGVSSGLVLLVSSFVFPLFLALLSVVLARPELRAYLLIGGRRLSLSLSLAFLFAVASFLSLALSGALSSIIVAIMNGAYETSFVLFHGSTAFFNPLSLVSLLIPAAVLLAAFLIAILATKKGRRFDRPS